MLAENQRVGEVNAYVVPQKFIEQNYISYDKFINEVLNPSVIEAINNL